MLLFFQAAESMPLRPEKQQIRAALLFYKHAAPNGANARSAKRLLDRGLVKDPKELLAFLGFLRFRSFLRFFNFFRLAGFCAFFGFLSRLRLGTSAALFGFGRGFAL